MYSPKKKDPFYNRYSPENVSEDTLLGSHLRKRIKEGRTAKVGYHSTFRD